MWCSHGSSHGSGGSGARLWLPRAWANEAPAAAARARSRSRRSTCGSSCGAAGELRPDGTRVKRGGAWAQGVATYTLGRPAAAGRADAPARLRRRVARGAGSDRARRAGSTRSRSAITPTGRSTPAPWWSTATGARLRCVWSVPAAIWWWFFPRAPSLSRCATDRRAPPLLAVWLRARRCSLSGALAPLPSAPAEGGVYLPDDGRVVAPARWSVQAELATPGDVRPGRAARARARRYCPTRCSWSAGTARSPRIPRCSSARAGTDRALPAGRGDVRVHTMQPRPSGQVPDDRRSQLRSDLAGDRARDREQIIELLGRARSSPHRPTRRWW